MIDVLVLAVLLAAASRGGPGAAADTAGVARGRSRPPAGGGGDGSRARRSERAPPGRGRRPAAVGDRGARTCGAGDGRTRPWRRPCARHGHGSIARRGRCSCPVRAGARRSGGHDVRAAGRRGPDEVPARLPAPVCRRRRPRADAVELLGADAVPPELRVRPRVRAAGRRPRAVAERDVRRPGDAGTRAASRGGTSAAAAASPSA